MSIPIALITLALLVLVVLIVTAPLRARRSGDAEETSRSQTAGEPPADGEEATIARDELESAREAKYREIRDAELDYRTGKLSRTDYEVVDGELRAEAIEILNRLEGRAGEGRAGLDADGGTADPATGAVADAEAEAEGAAGADGSRNVS